MWYVFLLLIFLEFVFFKLLFTRHPLVLHFDLGFFFIYYARPVYMVFLHFQCNCFWLLCFDLLVCFDIFKWSLETLLLDKGRHSDFSMSYFLDTTLYFISMFVLFFFVHPTLSLFWYYDFDFDAIVYLLLFK